jgi:divalent metal cation (Fe/Co/Zn/Cd) transporter
LQHPQPIEGGWMGFGVFVLYAVVSLGLAAMNQRNNKRQPSPLLELQVKLFLSKALFDSLMAASLGLALLCPQWGWTVYLDPLAAMVGVTFMLHAVWSTTENSVHDLLDVTLNEQMQLQILECLVRHFDQYVNLHGVRTRRSGPNVFVEVLLEFDPESSMKVVQDSARAIEADILQIIGQAQVSIVLSSGAPKSASVD